MLYIAITGHLKDELIGFDLHPADQFWTLIWNNILRVNKYKKSGYAKKVSHHKLDRQNGNIPLTVTGKTWVWLLQI